MSLRSLGLLGEFLEEDRVPCRTSYMYYGCFLLGVSLKKRAQNLRKTSTWSTAEFYFAKVPHFATSFFLEGVEGQRLFPFLLAKSAIKDVNSCSKVLGGENDFKSKLARAHSSLVGFCKLSFCRLFLLFLLAFTSYESSNLPAAVSSALALRGGTFALLLIL